jgi:hypothetical protein
MKRILLTAMMLMVLASCYDNWDGKVNGRRYKLQHTCIESHSESSTRMQPMGKTFIILPDNKEVCDKYKIDTIWEKLTNQHDQ